MLLFTYHFRQKFVRSRDFQACESLQLCSEITPTHFWNLHDSGCRWAGWSCYTSYLLFYFYIDVRSRSVLPVKGVRWMRGRCFQTLQVSHCNVHVVWLSWECRFGNDIMCSHYQWEEDMEIIFDWENIGYKQTVSGNLYQQKCDCVWWNRQCNLVVNNQVLAKTKWFEHDFILQL